MICLWDDSVLKAYVACSAFQMYRDCLLCLLFLKNKRFLIPDTCVSKLNIIGSDNGLLPGRRQAIIWFNAGILIIRTLGTNCSEFLSEIHKFSLKKMHLKVSSGKRRASCLGFNVLTQIRGGDQALNFLNCVARNHGATSYETISTLIYRNNSQNTFFSYLEYSLVVILTYLSLYTMAAILAGDVFKRIFLKENDKIPIPILLKLAPKSAIDNESVLDKVMAWCGTDDKASCEPVLSQFPDAYTRP